MVHMVAAARGVVIFFLSASLSLFGVCVAPTPPPPRPCPACLLHLCCTQIETCLSRQMLGLLSQVACGCRVLWQDLSCDVAGTRAAKTSR
jgi:hypothetical protein